jgi:hypothetical protein
LKDARPGFGVAQFEQAGVDLVFPEAMDHACRLAVA